MRVMREDTDSSRWVKENSRVKFLLFYLFPRAWQGNFVVYRERERKNFAKFEMESMIMTMTRMEMKGKRLCGEDILQFIRGGGETR